MNRALVSILKKWRISVFSAALLALSFGCAKKETDAIAINEAGRQDETSAAKIQDKPLEQIMQAAKALIRNPFLTEEEENRFIDTGNLSPADHLILSAVMYSSLNKSRAIVNGQILKMGDYIDNKEIVEILPEAVILKNARAQYIIKLKTGSGI